MTFTPGARLPPFPDDLLDAARLDDVIDFLRFQPMPSRIRRRWLQTWASYTEATVDVEHYARVAGRAPADEA